MKSAPDRIPTLEMGPEIRSEAIFMAGNVCVRTCSQILFWSGPDHGMITDAGGWK